MINTKPKKPTRGRPTILSSDKDKIIFVFASLYLFAVGVWWWKKQQYERAKVYYSSSGNSTSSHDSSDQKPSDQTMGIPKVVINPPLDWENTGENIDKIKEINKRDLKIPPLPPLPSSPKISPPKHQNPPGFSKANTYT
ncbi:MAG TPA: hypothetical protein IGQ44_03115, partial [Geminocystis sp. M7585_C2015_104]|nr:hypothetical protein [Geminocystis sp. M7585_C2015_104]